jgi:hypothetical protein
MDSREWLFILNRKETDPMAMKGKTKCAVAECTLSISGFNNLCEEHVVPGMEISWRDSTMVLTFWYAERDNETGIIIMDDWAIGEYFSGRAGFEAKLEKQGFVRVRCLESSEEVDEVIRSSVNKKAGSWDGP